MRIVFRIGRNVCGESNSTTVNTTSPPKASDFPATPGIAAVVSVSGRHQIAPALSAIALLRHAPLLPGHTDRIPEHLDLVETGVLIPAGFFRVEKFELVFGRVPVVRLVGDESPHSSANRIAPVAGRARQCAVETFSA